MEPKFTDWLVVVVFLRESVGGFFKTCHFHFLVARLPASPPATHRTALAP